MLDAGESNPDAAADTDSEDQDPLESVISAHDAKDSLGTIDCCNFTQKQLIRI